MLSDLQTSAVKLEVAWFNRLLWFVSSVVKSEKKLNNPAPDISISFHCNLLFILVFAYLN